MNEKTLLYGALSLTAAATVFGIVRNRSLHTSTNTTDIPVVQVPPDEASTIVTRAEIPIRLTASDGTGLKLASLRADAVVEDPLALTELHLVFENPEDRVLEGTFRMTLPQGASLSRFAMRVGDAWQEGEVVEKQAARQAYEDFLHRKQDPALMEQGAGNEFSARVFPIPARGKKEIIVTYAATIETGAPYVLPLRGLSSLETLDVEVHATGKKNAEVGGTSDTSFRTHQTNITPSADFVVEGSKLPRSPGLRSEDIAIARVIPFTSSRPDPISSVLFLVDTSASRGLGLTEQTRLLAKIVGKLPPATNVVVAAFDQDVVPIFEGSASTFDDAATKAIEARSALGASNVERAVAWAKDRAARSKTKRVVWIGDGVATAGETDPQKLKARVEELRSAGVERMDAIAVGGLRDDAFLRTLVRGVLDHDGTVLDASLGAHALVKRLSEATTSGVPVKVEGADWSWPTTLDGLQAGDEVLVYAKLPPTSPVRITVGTQQFSPDLKSAPRPIVERAWAQAKIQSLVDAPVDDPQTTKRQIVSLSTAHRVLSPYTAMLVLETDADYRRFGIDRTAKVDILAVKDGRIAVTETPRAWPNEWETAKRKGDVARPRPTPPSATATATDRDEARAGSSAAEPEAPAEALAAAPAAQAAPAMPGAMASGPGANEPVPPPPPAPPADVADDRRDRSADGFGAAREEAPTHAAPRRSMPPRRFGDGIGETGGLDLGGGGATQGSGTGVANGSGSGRASAPATRQAPPTAPRPVTPPPIGGNAASLQVRPGALVIERGLELDAVQVVLRGATSRLRGCFESASSNGAARGRLEVRVTIATKGAVTSVVPIQRLSSERLESCSLDVLRSLTFPTTGSEGQFTTSFDFVDLSDRSNDGNVARNPSDVPEAAPYEGRFRTVMEKLARGDKDDALGEAKSWQREQPGDVLALVALGEAYEALGDRKTAARAYGSILELFSFRADSRRFAGERLERLDDRDALELAADTYAKAAEQRPDHPASHRLLGYALLKAGKPADAFEAIRKGAQRTYPAGRFAGVDRILKEDLGLVAAAWIKAEPERREEIVRKLREAGGTEATGPSLRFVLNWETDANDVDFHIHDARGGHAYYAHRDLPSGGQLYADVTTGYGPECFTIPKARDARTYPYTLQAHYYSRGPMGYGMGKLEIIDHDGKGGLTFEERPFVVMTDRAYVNLGVVEKTSAAIAAKP